SCRTSYRRSGRGRRTDSGALRNPMGVVGGAGRLQGNAGCSTSVEVKIDVGTESPMDTSVDLCGAGSGGRTLLAAAVYDRGHQPQSAGRHSPRHGVGVSARVALGQLPDGVAAVFAAVAQQLRLGDY